jgi:transmembrane sensor
LAAFERAESVIAEIAERAAEISAILDRPSAEILTFPARPPPSRPRKAPGPAIAAAVAGLALALGFGVWRSSLGKLETWRTAPGETRSVTLADGSRIELDSATTISARLGWFSRRLRLGVGEASFDVAKDPNRPFIVAVGDQNVRVIGTEFNIGDYDGALDVTVRRGVVNVYQPRQGDAPIARLTSGWKLEHRVGDAASVVRRVDPDLAFAWREGRLICNDEPLPRIVAYLNRRYEKPIRLSPAAAGRRFSGVLELGDQGEVVRHIAAYLSLGVNSSNVGEIRLD